MSSVPLLTYTVPYSVLPLFVIEVEPKITSLESSSNILITEPAPITALFSCALNVSIMLRVAAAPIEITPPLLPSFLSIVVFFVSFTADSFLALIIAPPFDTFSSSVKSSNTAFTYLSNVIPSLSKSFL